MSRVLSGSLLFGAPFETASFGKARLVVVSQRSCCQRHGGASAGVPLLLVLLSPSLCFVTLELLESIRRRRTGEREKGQGFWCFVTLALVASRSSQVSPWPLPKDNRETCPHCGRMAPASASTDDGALEQPCSRGPTCNEVVQNLPHTSILPHRSKVIPALLA